MLPTVLTDCEQNVQYLDLHCMLEFEKVQTILERWLFTTFLFEDH